VTVAAILGQQIVVENRPGASGMLGLDLVAKAVVGATTELAEAAKTEIQAIATLKKDTNWLTIVRK
jgi:tripartite-type tricarboxylate transporter receptor subunit TctC